MGQVIQLHATRQAKAAGVFAAVAIAADRMGFSPERAVILARAAKLRVLGSPDSPARVVADAKAELRRDAPKVLA
jgi:hypothetical protein